MGSPEDEEGRYADEGPKHRVIVPAFFMGKYPVTQLQWRAVSLLTKIELDLDRDPSMLKGDNRPVECVSWGDAVEFCKRLSKHSGKAYRLPSEAEWEYACRARTTTPYNFGETFSKDLASIGGRTTEVGKFGANGFGLYDMHGNVWEWCLDPWHESYEGAPTDGSAWLTGDDDSSRVLRGGSWHHDPVYCRTAVRSWNMRGDRLYVVGFRVVCAAS